MNPDLVLVRRFMEAPDSPLAVDSNPLAIALGATLEAYDPDRRELTMGYAPQPLFWQGAGMVQGGALSSMLDFVMAFAGITQMPDGAAVSTLNMNASFLKPATAPRYLARGRIDKPGRRAMFASAELSADGNAVAMATCTLLVLPAAAG